MKAGTFVIAVGVLGAAVFQTAAAQPVEKSPTVSTPQCDSVSFANGTAENRAACRRVYARDMRSTARLPQWAVDYEW